MRLHELLPCFFLFIAACQPEPAASPEPPPLRSAVGPSPKPPVVPLAPSSPPIATTKATAPPTWTFSTLAVPLTDERTAVEPGAVIDALHALEPAVRACALDRDTEAKAWIVARLDRAGSLSLAQTVRSSFSKEASECMRAVLEKARIPSPSAPLALSMVARRGSPSASEQGPVSAPLGSLSSDGPVNAIGTLTGGALTEAQNVGGLGSGVIGNGGGGTGEGTIGLGTIGTSGRGGSGSGFGSRQPLVNQAAQVHATGSLSRLVIRRVVRTSFGQLRSCYERALVGDPTLSGRVGVKFTIEESGSVSGAASDASTTLTDEKVVACVVSTFAGMTFPPPEHGKVVVSYPVAFSPNDGAPAKATTSAAPKAIRVAGKGLDSLTSADLLTLFGKPAGEGQNAVTVALDGKSGAPFVVFAESRDEVFAIARVKGRPKGEPAPVSPSGFALVERSEAPPNGRALRIYGASDRTTGELMDSLAE